MARFVTFFVYLCVVYCSLCAPSLAQQPQYPAPGFPMFSTQVGSQYDQIDIANGNISLVLPFRNIAAGPLPLSYTLFAQSNAYDYNPGNGLVWQITSPLFSLSQNVGAIVTWVPDPEFQTCNGNLDTLYSNFAVVDTSGTGHPVNILPFDSQGCYTFQAGTYPAEDGSGYTVILSGTYSSWSTTLYDKSGNKYTSTGNGASTTVVSPDNVTAQSVTGVGTSTMTITDALTSSPVAVASYINNGLSSATYTDFQGSSTSPPYSINYKSYNVATDFACSGIGERSSGPAQLISSITTPATPTSGTYSFTYEATPNKSGYVTGRIASITLPSGGSISFAYSGGNSGINCTSGVVPTLTRKVNDNNGNTETWTYVNSNTSRLPYTNYTVVVTDPANNQTIYYMQQQFQTQVVSFQGGCPTSVAGCKGGGTLLRTVTTCYNGVFTNCSAPSPITGPPVANFSQTDVFTSYNGGDNNLVETKFDTYGDPIEVKHYDFVFTAVAAPTVSPLSDTLAYYGQSWNGTSCTAYPSGIYVYTTPCYTYTKNSSGTTVAQTQVTYNNTGHPTTIKRWTSGSSWLTSSATYNSNGTAATSTDPSGAVSSYSYTGTGGCNDLLPTSVTVKGSGLPAAGLSTSAQWNCNGGVVTQTADANNQPTNYSYNDPLWRQTEVSYPDGGSIATTYNTGSTHPWSVSTNSPINSSTSLGNTTIYDGLGRVTQTQLTSDPEGADYVDTTYDSLGRIATVSNPHRTASSATDGTTTYGYDALNRVTSVLDQDGSKASATYANNCSTVTDEIGHSRESCVDGIGRTTVVYEDPGTSPHLNYETDYSYDALNNLLSATQKGGAASGSWRVRSFAYDGLSRLASETNPESGTVIYAYNSDGDLATRTAPAPNQTGSATVTTTYNHDALHRLTGKIYSDGTTPTNYYDYDVAAPWMTTAKNVAGRLANSSNQYGGGTSGLGTATAYGYDAMGRIVQDWEQTPSISPGGSYVLSSYDLIGNLTSTTDAPGTTATYGHDGASRITTITSSLNDAHHPPTLWTADSAQGYYPEGDLEKATFGNGLTESRVYTPRLSLPPCRINLNTSGGIPTGCSGALPTGIVQSYQLYYGAWGSAVNGNIDAWGGSGVQNFNRGYGYDSLNRLASMSDVAPQPCQGLTWTIDAWGNMIAQTTTAGTCNSFSSSVNTKNQLQSGYQYDAAGNVTYDGVHNYTYDAENRIIRVDSGSTATYVYNENGQRVRKSTAPGAFTEFFYGPNGLVQSVYNGSAWPAEYVFAGSRLIADYTNGATDFVLTDHLGSTRLLTGVNQAVLSNMDYMPFGQQIAGGSATTDKFTGQEYDSESGLYQFPFRYYESPMARFMTPDPAGLAAADPSNPQSWNQYAYALNNPLALVDPTGLDDCDTPGDCDSTPEDPTSGGEPVNPNTEISGNDFSILQPSITININIGYNGGSGGSSFSWCYQCPGQFSGQYFSSEPFSFAASDFDAIVSGTNAALFWNAANNGNFSWWGAFAKNLFSLKNFTAEFKQGGCVNVFGSATAGALNPFSPSLSSAGEGTAAVLAASKYNAAVQYAASAPNYLGGTGLIYPMKSSVVRSMVADANATAASGALMTLDLALAQGFGTEMYSMATGGCH